MDLPTNIFKAALKEGRAQIGLWSTFADASVAELLAGCGYDWIMFDTEHSPSGPPEVIALLRAVAPYPVTAVVRPGWNNPVEIKKLLDAGAQTLLIPYIQNADEARAAVSAVTYPPKGIRGVSGSTRATRYGAVADYAKRANEEICLLLQVETREALGHLEDIASVEGVDGVFFGPADLAASFGYPGQPSHPQVKAAILDGIRTLKKRSVPAGILSLDQDFLKDAREAGATFIAVDLDSGLLRRSAMARRAEWM
ncbi:MAG: 4-hydroxy-2-oxo-heptane-1,7-dioate aldolase [Fulvimarina manganoxydans]|uniref:HpcH/HpaI aldolase family protein n=1 Tax=Fulvimarina manganoxydans TaxID=937218 RepID=UPI0023549FBC|nr:aldolase/citrate lyase family protein [Fulvimarina manganoxydans]MCK5933808.1 4-hydroxy-2-oxo-heptane-1,7-dioate aldolase [Fulvimarina manganoxydans]